MSNIYIRSQDKERLYVFGISFNSLRYEETQDYKRGKEEAVHHTICIADGCLEEIAEYESKERCMEVLDEIEKVCGSYLYAEGSTGLLRKFCNTTSGSRCAKSVPDAGEIRRWRMVDEKKVREGSMEK